MSDILDPRSVFIYDVSETLTASETKKLIHLMQRNVNGWTLLSEYEVVELNSSGSMALIKMMQFLERKLEFVEAIFLLLAALEKIGRSDLVHQGLAKGIGSCNPAPREFVTPPGGSMQRRVQMRGHPDGYDVMEHGVDAVDTAVKEIDDRPEEQRPPAPSGCLVAMATEILHALDGACQLVTNLGFPA